MVCQKGSRFWSTRWLSSAPRLLPDHLRRPLLLGVPIGARRTPRPARTSARPWPPLCSSSSLSRTWKLRPPRRAEPPPRLRTPRVVESPPHPGTRLPNLHLQLGPLKARWPPLPPLRPRGSRRTRTSVFPTEPPAEPH